jgi:Fe2+ transport system protein FeoA
MQKMSKEKIGILSSLQSGDKAVILKISGRAFLRRRLLDMGVIPGAVVEMVRRAPLGDPIDVKIKGYHLSLRVSEASHITIERFK